MKYTINTGETIDIAFQRIAGNEGLYCVAFFGHKGNTKKLAYIWNRLLKLRGAKC